MIQKSKLSAKTLLLSPPCPLSHLVLRLLLFTFLVSYVSFQYLWY